MLDEVKSFHKVVQSDEDSDIFLALVEHNVDVHLRSLIPLLLFGLLLEVRMSKLLNGPTELHHVNGPSCHLGRYHIVLISLSDEILLDNSQELTHVGVRSHHLFESLHSVYLDQF